MSYLTDDEKRLLFSALTREKKVCEEVDKGCCREPYETPLKRVVEGLERKFYYDRFEKEIRDKAIDEFVGELKQSIKQLDKYKDGIINIYESFKTIDEIAEKMKEVGE